MYLQGKKDKKCRQRAGYHVAFQLMRKSTGFTANLSADIFQHTTYYPLASLMLPAGLHVVEVEKSSDLLVAKLFQ